MKQVGNYLVDEKAIGSGGMGQVFKGTAPDGRPVAIKEILPTFVADPEYRSRIEREMEFMKKLDNPNVVKIYDNFEMNGSLYIVMELIEGADVEKYISDNGAMEWHQALDYMIKLLGTLQDVHNHGIVHRDIKPGNIMIRSNGEICLLDFGVAKDISTPAKEGATVIGTVIGTDGYMSPEQAAGMSIDHRADIYSLGCVLFYILTGSHAYTAMSDFEMKSNILTKAFPRLDSKVVGLPPSLQVVLDRAVDKNMANRHQTCAIFAEQLDCVLTGKTVMRTGMDNQQYVISVGREGCDISFGPENLRVSRHHADIRLKRFTGGEFYIYSDCSSNGTVINGQPLSNGMSYNIPRGENATIFLAGDQGSRLSMRQIEQAMRSKYPDAFGSPESEIDSDKVQTPGTPPPIEGFVPPAGGIGVPADSRTMGFGTAIKTCFTKYADFSGRASRAEYWWWALFTFLINTVIFTVGLLTIDSADVYIFLEETEFAMEVGATTFVIYCLWSLAVLLPSLAVLIRRLHDVGRGWKLFFCLFIPVANIYFGIYMFILLCTAGDQGPNKYGPSTATGEGLPPMPQGVPGPMAGPAQGDSWGYYN